MNERCELCGSDYIVQNHHIIHGRGKRTQCETSESQIKLCWSCHHGKYGVHGTYGHELDMRLKLELQDKYFRQGKTEEEVRKLMGGRLY